MVKSGISIFNLIDYQYLPLPTGMKMYVNCELKAQSKGSEHCIGCHSHGCHVTDTNTLLMIGRPNYSPHFHCTKFDSGDIAFWEKYLSANDVETLCGAPTGELNIIQMLFSLL